MDKIKITTLDDGLTHEFPVEDLSKVSDGYHTIQELYDHRCLLWINFCLVFRKYAYLIEKHLNDDWHLLGLDFEDGTQMSYHIPTKYLKYVNYIPKKHVEWKNGFGEVEKKWNWDGHTSKDVLKRLEDLAGGDYF